MRITEGQYALGALTLLAVWLFVALPYLNRHPQQTPQINAQQHADAALKGQQDTKAGSPQSAPANEQHGGKHAEQGNEEGTEFWPTFMGLRLKITDSLLAIFTGGLLIFTGLLWRSTDKLWLAGERQLRLAREALVADQRAWLILKDFRIENFNFYNLNRGAADVQAEIYFEIANVGRTPAVNFNFQMSLIGNWETEVDAAREYASKAYRGAEFGGRMVSSGERIEESEILFASAAELYRYGERGEVRPLIVGCITYQIIQDSEFRQTAFIYRPEKIADSPRLYSTDGELDVNAIQAVAGHGGFAT